MSRFQQAATRLLLFLFLFLSVPALAENGAAPGYEAALLAVELNGARSDEPVLFVRAADGSLFAPSAVFAGWRLRAPRHGAISRDGETWFPLSGIRGLRFDYSEADQSVVIDAPVSAFERQTESLSVREEGPMNRPATGLFLNYDLVAERSRGDTSVSGAFDLGLFTRRGVGQATFMATAGRGPERLVRLETSWTIDRPRNATTFRVGDTLSAPGPGTAPVRIAGVQFARNFAIRPGFVTIPLPAASGAAAVPSVVDVYVNNILQGSRRVDPGPFELTNVPVMTGGGQVRIVVRDLLGREIVSEQPYYASSQLLRRGLHDFSYEVGVVREDFGRVSNRYGQLIASTYHRYGLNDRVTIEGQAQASKSRQLISVAATALAFEIGQIGSSISVSHGPDGVGQRAALSFERRGRSLSFGALAEYSSRHFGSIGMDEHNPPPRFTLQAYADFAFDRGVIGANILHRTRWGRPGETLAGVSGSYRLRPGLQLGVFGRRSVAGSRETVFGAHLSVTLGARRHAAVAVEHDARGASARLSYQQGASGLGGSLRTAAAVGHSTTADLAYVHELPMATLGAQAGYAGDSLGLRLTAAGAVGTVGGRLFASRNLGESFAAVSVGRPGVRVFAEDRLVGVTGPRGTLIVPGLRPYERNRIRIDESDLPLDAHLDIVEANVRPFARTGTILQFSIRSERGVLMQVLREDGSALPAGARVAVESGEPIHVVASGGEVYVPGLRGHVRLRARWNGGECAFTATVPDNDDPQPRLERVLCQPETVYASN
jgi:outer membrane usher protein